ncbi:MULTISPECIES: fructosamine kinase family protein [Trichocoleus]|uniref:Fructosamine kinase family protein n=1 Tax=Trichocoleus desertorum GB2-A4 TaxID=2933944 RepID=A0ABV0J1R2_9CYAN|nr:fructosamine kinase family protein [Trichocoleus sp. FACHB-46]MBD1860333.1 fructosamine kinase family protein [Trichocoleus sp. FACHB-46]
MWTTIAAQITQATGYEFQVSNQRSVGGGCINQGYALQGYLKGNPSSDKSSDPTACTYFVKLNQAAQVTMFEAEALGLQQMRIQPTVRVPEPICWGVAENSAYIVLEWIELGRGDRQSWEAMGRQLAAMHQVTSPVGFGWDRPNTIGSTSQINPWTKDWAEFFTQHRIGYQLKLAQRRGGHFPKQDRLLAAIPELLANHQPPPALVHGDLWSGNAAVAATGEPVIFDPATYFGDREVDIAMTELFGGFPPEFYQGYNQAWPLEAGYKQRKTLYNLYHVLNHFNLFGGSYESQANRMIEQILA